MFAHIYLFRMIQILILHDHSNSFIINLESFRTFRGLQFHKQIIRTELFFGSTVFLSGSSFNKIRIKWIFKRYFTSLFEQVVQPPRYELFYTLTNCKRSCLSSHLHRCKKRISPILCFWNCSISRIPSFLQTFYVDSIHVDFDMKWCSKSVHENALPQIQL